FLEGFFLVGEFRRLDSREPRGATFRRIACALNLLGQGMHVIEQTRFDQGRGIELGALRVFRAFFENFGKILEEADENGDRSLIHGKGHCCCPEKSNGAADVCIFSADPSPLRANVTLMKSHPEEGTRSVPRLGGSIRDVGASSFEMAAYAASAG